MLPMETNQQVLSRLCLKPADHITIPKRLFNAAYTIVMVSLTVAVFISSLMFFLKFLPIDLETALFPIWQINGFFTVGFLMSLRSFVS